MIVCSRTSTFSCSASASALRSGRTLNPMMMAFDADASSTSDSLIAPTPEWITRILTFSFDSFWRVSVSTSADPPTSVLMMIGSSLTSPACICLCSCSRVRRLDLASAASLALWSRKLTICLAFAVSVTTWKSSPASGSESRPSTSTGVEGSALRICVPRSFSMARTLPNTEPTMKKSPTLNVPLRTSTVATGPRPRSSCASMTVPIAGTRRIGLQVLHFRNQQNHFEHQVEVLVRLGGYRHHDRVAAPIFRQQAAIGELLLDPLGLRVGLVDLVDRHDDRHLGRLGVVDGFQGLRHDAVVRRHHQDDDIGHLGAAGAHAGERFVTGGVDEDDLLAIHVHLVSADVLRDAAGFASRDIGFADGVEQRGLAVIDVAHDGDHGRALLTGP